MEKDSLMLNAITFARSERNPFYLAYFFLFLSSSTCFSTGSLSSDCFPSCNLQAISDSSHPSEKPLLTGSPLPLAFLHHDRCRCPREAARKSVKAGF